MKTNISKNGTIDTIDLHDLIEKYQLDDLEAILAVNQRLIEAIVLLTKDCDLKNFYAVSLVAKAISVLQDVNRVNWEEYISYQE